MNLSEEIMDLALWYADEILMLEKKYNECAEVLGKQDVVRLQDALLNLDKSYDAMCECVLLELTDRVNKIVAEVGSRNCRCGGKCADNVWLEDDLK